MLGKEYVIPALNIGQVRRFQEDGTFSKASGNADSPEKMSAQIKVIHTAMKRNYPEITTEEIEEMVDMGNLVKIVAAVFGQSGMVAVGEAVARK